ncbi:MAG: glycosyltransferase family 4 protein, partial [Acidobacteriota bacterium]|nr:glycosyltransferase family 4 protein [Acidobacteriota bacterium]
AAAGRAGSERLTTVTVPVHARNRVQWVLGEQLLLPRLAARAGVDLVHSLASTAPAWGSFKRVVTVHDLIYARFPEAHSGLRDLGVRVLVPLAVRRSDRVMADSETTRRDLAELLGADQARIDVVALGMGAVRREEPAAQAGLRARLNLGERPVVLTLSAKRPHKNLMRLIDAIALIDAERRPVLVAPGYPTWHEDELRVRVGELGLDTDVRLLHWLSAAELEGLWAMASAFVFPSLYEGFGLPVLEAMARGVPVACSDASSLPEVAGDAALLFDPHDPAAIARALERLLGDEREAARLRDAGLARAAHFTWERTACLTLQSYARAMGLGEVPSSWTTTEMTDRAARDPRRVG